MAVSIKKLAGATDDLIEKLATLGITNSNHLLDSTATPSKRKKLAKRADVDREVILELANRADLSRVKGVAGVFSNLLEQSGVDTVKELATRRAENLHAKMVEVNEKHNIAKLIPIPAEIENWVAQAKELPKILSY